jgi:hypothetical protein
MDMKNGTLQGGDSHPGRLAGIKAGQLKGCQFSSVQRSDVQKPEVRSSEANLEDGILD